MAQTYPDINSSDLISSSRVPLLNRDDAVKSNFSGSAFPSTGLLVGMLCYRTDLTQLYVLESTGPSVWVQIQFGSTLGSAAAEDTGTSGHTLGFLDGANTWSDVQTYAAAQAIAGQSIGGNSGALTMDTDVRLNANTGKIINFLINSASKMSIAADGGLFMAGATGSSEGAGTINAVNLFINGVALGSAAMATLGTAANNALQITAAGKYPALDGSLITGVASIVKQTAYVENVTQGSISSVIPFNNTVPVSGAGTTVLSTTVTPANTTNKLRVRFKLNVAASAEYITAAVFAGSTCISANYIITDNAGGVSGQQITDEFVYVPGTTAAQVITVQLGVASGSIYLNGGPNGAGSPIPVGGGTSRCTLAVEELSG